MIPEMPTAADVAIVVVTAAREVGADPIAVVSRAPDEPRR